jgi:hypothetical protein
MAVVQECTSLYKFIKYLKTGGLKNMRGVSLKIILAVIILAIIATTSGTSYYFYTQYKKTKAILADPSQAAKEEIKVITTKISVIMELPSGEEPTIATILDKEKLKDQPFFARSANGDKVLIFAQARKAILYRPSTNKVIDVAPINIGQSSLPLKIALYNGTTINGLADTLEKELKEKITGIEVATKDNAQRKDYTKTLVVDLLGTRSTEAAQLAQFLKSEVSSLPANETRPEVSGQVLDLLVIIGNDYELAKAVTPTPAHIPTISPTKPPAITPSPSPQAAP